MYQTSALILFHCVFGGCTSPCFCLPHQILYQKKYPKMSTLLLPLFLLTPLVAGSAITAAPEFRPALLRRQAASVTGPATSCVPWLDLENSCAAANPSFTLLTAFASQAPCLCYSSSTWAPDVYDSALATCLSYLATASPVYYTSLNGPNLPRTPCLEVASLVSPGASGVTSSPASSDPYYSACLSFEAISSSCNAEVPGFATMPISAEENCLCYTSGTYAPSIFDGYWASCLTYYSTASPAIYSSSLDGDAGVRSPCALIEPTATAAASTAVQTTSASAMASSGAGVTSVGPTSTNIALTTTAAATTTMSASGSSAVESAGRVSIIGLLLLGIFTITLLL